MCLSTGAGGGGRGGGVIWRARPNYINQTDFPLGMKFSIESLQVKAHFRYTRVFFWPSYPPIHPPRRRPIGQTVSTTLIRS